MLKLVPMFVLQTKADSYWCKCTEILNYVFHDSIKQFSYANHLIRKRSSNLLSFSGKLLLTKWEVSAGINCPKPLMEVTSHT